MATQTEALSYTFYHVTGRHYESTVKIKKYGLVCAFVLSDLLLKWELQWFGRHYMKNGKKIFVFVLRKQNSLLMPIFHADQL